MRGLIDQINQTIDL